MSGGCFELLTEVIDVSAAPGGRRRLRDDVGAGEEGDVETPGRLRWTLLENVEVGKCIMAIINNDPLLV